ncbi:MAG TPA: hypothetical protein DEO71_17285 [Chryseobacterium sp.]|nr:hypothetical protein [Chryseobacterium sp.]
MKEHYKPGADVKTRYHLKNTCMKISYSELIGMTKNELLNTMGDDFNFYPDAVWIYLLDKNFLGRKTFLIVRFDQNIIVKTEIKKAYGNIKQTRL